MLVHFSLYPMSVRKLLRQDNTSAHAALQADSRDHLSLFRRYEMAAGVTVVSPWRVNLFTEDCRFLRKSVVSRGLWAAASSLD